MEKKISKEEAIIQRTAAPMTRERLRHDFAGLGLTPGMCLMVHTSMSAIGWIPGGVQLLIEALIEHLGPDGTLVAPTHSTHMTDPKDWEAPPVPEAWHEDIRNGFPAFDPRTTPSRGMGALPEALRTWPGAIRSNHPHTSFCALGPLAAQLTDGHDLSSPLGKASPLQKLYDVNASALLLGVGFDRNTCFHLAEDDLKDAPRFIDGAAVRRNGQPFWVKFDSVDYDSDDFEKLGAAFENSGQTSSGQIGAANCQLFRIRNAVDFSLTWLRQNR